MKPRGQLDHVPGLIVGKRHGHGVVGPDVSKPAGVLPDEGIPREEQFDIHQVVVDGE